MYRYLRQFLLDPRVIDLPWLKRNLLVQGLILPFRTGNSTKLYQQLWTKEGSPLKFYGERLAQGVQSVLGDGYVVELAMRYQQPSIESAVERLRPEATPEFLLDRAFRIARRSNSAAECSREPPSATAGCVWEP